MIEQLQQGSRRAVQAIATGQQMAGACLAEGDAANGALAELHRAIDTVSQMSTQIAAAVEEQGVVAEQVSRSVAAIRDLAHRNATASGESADATGSVRGVCTHLVELVEQFWMRRQPGALPEG